MDVFEAVRTVLAVRAYQEKPVPPEIVRRIVDAGRLTASSMNGSGWSCTVSTVTCTRGDALAAGSSYPAITLTVNVDEHGNYLGGSASFQQTQTWSDYAFEDSTGHKWTLNGAPDISTVGLFTLQPNGTFGTASSIDISGAVRATGPGGSDHTADFLVTVNIDPDGRGGDVSGTVDGQSLHYSF